MSGQGNLCFPIFVWCPWKIISFSEDKERSRESGIDERSTGVVCLGRVKERGGYDGDFYLERRINKEKIKLKMNNHFYPNAT